MPSPPMVVFPLNFWSITVGHATVSIFKESYDVPMQFIGMKVEIRVLPDDMNSAYILYEGTKSPIHRTNRIDNCHTKRNNQNPLDYSKIGGND